MERHDAVVDEFTARLRRERATLALLPLFFVSGATALVYQTLWARQLHLVFGTSSFAISTVLAAFMAGLALGGFVMARWADRIRDPLRVYGILEVVIGLYALVFPTLLTVMTPLYLIAWRALEPPVVVFGMLQFVLVGLGLLLPTTLMGATLPLLARFVTDRLGAAGDRVGTLYAVNTAGAVAGTALCGFWLLPGYGLWTTTLLAALANLVLGASAIGIAQWSQGATTAPVLVDVKIAPMDRLAVRMALVAALAGFSGLVYEVAWTRVLGLMIGASTYAFTVMLLAFLVGIASGGFVGGRLSDRLLAKGGLARLLHALAVVQLGIATLSYALLWIYAEIPFLYIYLFDLFGVTENAAAIWGVSLLVAGLVMTPPAFLMGIAFPMTVRAVVRDVEALGGPVGTIYGANTLGALLGAFLAGFVFLPLIGIQWTIAVGAGVNVLAAAVLLDPARRGGERLWKVTAGFATGLVVLVLVVRPVWNPLVITAGMYKYAADFRDHSREGILTFTIGDYVLRYYKEGLSSVVTVAENTKTGNIWLANNGKVDASTTVDMPTQLLVSLLPFQFTEEREDVLVIGLASGITAGAVTLVPGVERLDVVELEPAIVPAARFFTDYNYGLLDDPRTNLIFNDGRNHLVLTPPQTYDVIISEPSNPWITGVSNLFTIEFYEMGKTRLVEGGVWGQWVQMYGMDEYDLRTMLATFAAVYDHVLLYGMANDNDLVLVGSDRPLVPGPEQARLLLGGSPELTAAMSSIELDSEWALMAQYQMDRDAILDFAEGAPLNTDDNMRIEYSAPLNLHEYTATDNQIAMLPHLQVPFEVLDGDAEALVALAKAYRQDEDFVRGILALTTAADWLERDDPRRDDWQLAAERWQAELLAEIEDLEADVQGDEDDGELTSDEGEDSGE